MRAQSFFLKILASLACAVLLGSPTPALAGSEQDAVPIIAVLGDSLAAGYGLVQQESFPARLQEAMQQAGIAVQVVNAAVSGDTTAGGLARLDWLLADRPDMVIVELGGNDALRGLPPEQTLANLDAILVRLKSAGVKILLAGMRAPRNLGEDYTRRFDRIYPELAERHQVSLYPFFLDGVAMNPGLNLPDGIHPNSEGIKVIVEGILPLTIRVLARP